MSTKKDVPQINWDDPVDVAKTIFRPGIETSEVTRLYNEWAKHGTYEKSLPEDIFGCRYPMQSAMQELFPADRDRVIVLDVGCGTGVTGEALLEAGFTTFDGVDPAKDMLQKADEKGIYRRLFNLYLTGEPTDLAADSYDAIVMVAVMHHGSIGCDAFEEMTRLVKPGGYIVNCVRRAFLQDVPEYRDKWEATVSLLEREGKWRVVSRNVYPRHFFQYEGECQIFEVL